MIVALVRVLVIDDMTLVRQGILSLLKDRDSVNIMGEAPDVREATALMGQLEPDVILLDQDMPDLGTAEAVTLLKQQHPKVEVIVLSESADEERAFQVLEAGASGYILKDISPDNLIRAIHGVCDGRTVMHPYITRQLVERFRLLMRERADHRDGHLSGLSSRELEIVVEMTKGATDREIARKACLGESTVKSHIRSILRKIGARNRTQAVAYMLRKGLMR
jgi:DNA-binding NarL/FixJ family response regulator